MKVIKTIVLTIILLVGGTAFAREGFCRFFEIPPDSNEILVTVPQGKVLVLRKLYAYNSSSSIQWYMTDGEDLFIDGLISVIAYNNPWVYMHDFPDRCVVVGGGKTLVAYNTHSSSLLKTTVIGYFDVPAAKGSDLNGDGIVNFQDFALMANKWMDTG